MDLSHPHTVLEVLLDLRLKTKVKVLDQVPIIPEAMFDPAAEVHCLKVPVLKNRLTTHLDQALTPFKITGLREVKRLQGHQIERHMCKILQDQDNMIFQINPNSI